MSIEAIVAAIDVELAKKLPIHARHSLQEARRAWAQNLPPSLWDPDTVPDLRDLLGKPHGDA